MRMRAVVTVIIDTAGSYYAGTEDLIDHLIGWTEGALDDRDNIQRAQIFADAKVIENEEGITT